MDYDVLPGILDLICLLIQLQMALPDDLFGWLKFALNSGLWLKNCYGRTFPGVM